MKLSVCGGKQSDLREVELGWLAEVAKKRKPSFKELRTWLDSGVGLAGRGRGSDGLAGK
jgi:hypothetical protein